MNLLKRAESYCELNKHRFTEPRQEVLSLLADCSEPMSVYQIVELFFSNKEKKNPPTVYRAIEFWHNHGFIHKVASMNAYIACCELKHHDNSCLFICNDCNIVIELESKNIPVPVMAELKSKRLTVSKANTEVYGVCYDCSEVKS